MRSVHKIDTRPVWYTPDIDDNRSDERPFRVLLRPLTARDKARAEHEIMVEAIRKGGSGEIPAGQFDRLAHHLVAACIVEVEGYSVVGDGEVHQIKTGEDLVDAVLSAAPDEMRVLDDLYAAITSKDKLDEGVRKNSGGRSASSSAQMSSPPEREDGSVTSGGQSGSAGISTMTNLTMSYGDNSAMRADASVS